MITYLATYPRSGSALLRGLIEMNFGHLTTSDAETDLTPYVKKFGLSAGPGTFAFPNDLWWGEGMATYQPKDGGTSRRILLPPSMQWLTPSVRQRLAAESTRFVVKTHNFPFDARNGVPAYFAGESAIQMVRHPGAACVSHYKLKRDFFRHEGASLTACIKGHSTGGSWSEYHKAWTRADIPLLRLRYEEVYGEQEFAIIQLGDFLGEPLPPVLKHNPLERAHAQNPVRNPGAGIDGWRADVSEADLDLLQERHGEVADCFGYRIRADEQSEAAE